MTEIVSVTQKMGKWIHLLLINDCKWSIYPFFWGNWSDYSHFLVFLVILLLYNHNYMPLHSFMINNHINRRRLIKHRAIFDYWKRNDYYDRQSSIANRQSPIARSRLGKSLCISLIYSQLPAEFYTSYIWNTV